jgi:hypothetical protein
MKLGMTLFALVALPLAMLKADLEPSDQGVRERLDIAVVNGVITQQQAEERWQAYLHDREGIQQRVSQPNPREQIELAIRNIRHAVAAGEITQAQADERLGQIRLRMGIRKKLEQAGLEIREAVSAGHITREEGRRRMEAMRRELTENLHDNN